MRAAPSIGVCSWSLRPDSCDALIESLASIPISAVQLALVPLIEHPRQWCDAVARLRSRGVQVVSGMMSTIGEDYSTLESIARTGGFRPDETWRGNLERALRLADLAADGGIALVTVHAGFIPDGAAEAERGGGSAPATGRERDAARPRSDERSRMLERVRTIAEVFARRGVALGLETGQERAATLIEFLKELAVPSVGVNFDPANMILYGMGDPVEALELLAPWVRQVHIKDALPTDRPGTWGREMPAGSGAVDWNGFGETLRSLQPPVDLVIEREQGGRRPDDVRTALQLARSMLPA